MTVPVLAVVGLLASGCALGSSSTVVGRWRARRVVDSTACVQTRASDAPCSKRLVIGRDVPARTYTSVFVAVAVPGYTYARYDAGKVDHSFALDNYVELAWGHGRFAIAGRFGLDFNIGLEDRNLLKFPLTLVGHLGGERGSIYVGAGYVPIAYEVEATGDEITIADDADLRFNGVRAIAGVRIRLRNSLERLISINPELKLERVGEYTLSSATLTAIFNY